MKKDVEKNHENTNQQTIFNKLIEPVDEFVNNQNEQLPKHSNQKFNYYNFFRILI